MKGKVKLTTVTKACEKDGETQPMIHHNLELKDRYGEKHRINCIQVDYITEPQDQVDPNVLHRIFPHIPKGLLNYPAMEVGLLLSQNANTLPPTRQNGKNKAGNLRVRRTVLGKDGYVLEGWHLEIRSGNSNRVKAQTFRIRRQKEAVPSVTADSLLQNLLQEIVS